MAPVLTGIVLFIAAAIVLYASLIWFGDAARDHALAFAFIAFALQLAFGAAARRRLAPSTEAPSALRRR
jgi:membrane protein implicated in regulation of membrane protease activity